jgi:Transposase IS200 like
VVVQHKDSAHRPFLLLTKIWEPYAITTRKWPKSRRNEGIHSESGHGPVGEIPHPRLQGEEFLGDKDLGRVFRERARQRESSILEGQLLPEYVLMLISIPPKYGDAQVVGFIKGKSAIYIAGTFLGRKKKFTGCSY